MNETLPLHGLRVVDLTEEVGELGGRILADLGADVLRVEPPGGMPTRRLPPLAPDGSSLWWATRNTNKRAAVFDLAREEARARLDRLLEEADVLLTTRAVDAHEVAARHPHLVVCSITWFGLQGPYADWVATDDVVFGMCGWLSSSGVSTRPPMLAPGSMSSDAAGVMSVFAVLTALWQRRTTGRGQLLDLSALEAIAQLDTWALPNTSAIAAAGMEPRRVRQDEFERYPVLRTKDGWIRVVVLAPRHWQALLEWMGFPEEWSDPYWEQISHRLANQDVLNRAWGEFFAPMETQAAAEEGQRRGIAITPVMAPADLLTDEHLCARGTFARAEVGAHREVPFASGFFELDGARAGYRTPAPAVGAPRDEVAWRNTPREDFGRLGSAGDTGIPRPERGPLSGVHVLDFGHGGVGVQGGRLLAEFGAEVIKVESRAYIDFMRMIMGGEMTPSFASSSRSKRGFGVNLKSEEGRALVRRLVEWADVVIENNSTGTMADLGLDFDALRAINPNIVYVSSQLLGSRGPRANWRGYGPSIQPYGGLTYLWRFPDMDPIGNNSIHPDLVAGHLCAIGALAGLFNGRARPDGDDPTRGGRATHAEIAQVEAVIGFLSDHIAAEALTPGSAGPHGNDDERGAPWGVFRCAGDEEWCVITVRDDADWAALRAAMDDPEWSADPRFATVSGRLAARAELNGLVERWTGERTPAEVAKLCQARGVPCGPMLYPSQLLSDPHLLARGFIVGVEQPGLGPLVFDGVSFLASDMAPPVEKPAPLLGEHTREIARELLGLDDAEVDRLIAAGVLEVPSP